MSFDPPTVDDQPLAEELRAAIEHGNQLGLLYQPVANAHSGEIRSVEALIRWEHPARGLLSPAQFLPVAERFDLLSPLTDCILDRALDQLGDWYGRGLVMQVTVNLFERDLHRPELVPWLSRGLAARGVPGHLLELEVPEPAVLAHGSMNTEVLAGLRRQGMRVSLDHFGTGCSTLTRLHDVPADAAKLSRELVSAVLDDPFAAEVVTALVRVAHAAGLEVIGEGVESGELWERLGDAGCDFIQGHRLAPGLSAEKVTNMLLGVTLVAG